MTPRDPVAARRPRPRGARTGYASLSVPVVVMASLAGLGLVACSSSAPNCEKAAAYVREARLAQAAQTYAQADRNDEGSCAADGLTRVAKLQADSLTAAAKGQAAEAAEDQRGARSAYESALKIDQGNAEAAAGLRRVSRRPDAIDPLWFTAQRLHDEGYDAEARAEVVKVLREHPDRTVPGPLAHLSEVTPTPSPVARSAAADRDAATSGPSREGGGAGWMLAALAGLIMLVGLASWWTARRTRLATAGIDSDVGRLGEIVETSADDSQRSIASIRSAVSALDRQVDVLAQRLVALDRRLAATTSSAAAKDELAGLGQQADEMRRTVKALEAAAQGHRQEMRQILRTLGALRATAPAMVVQSYVAAPDGGEEST